MYCTELITLPTLVLQRAPGNEVAYAPNTTADYQRIVGTQDGNKNEYIQQAVDEYKLKDQRTPEEMKELLLKDKNIIKVIRGKKLLHRKAARVESSVKHERQPKANRRTPSEPNVTPKKSDSSTR
ncbi:unnamed protein product [Gongylonema pulchrum]|uniref:DUF4316 domain-containing protein n=1 Tax=Gongylonema pulchrum TaxID=637853 RepID=A0A183DL62_9BILA|nr:unnamed protein product [Gongylonema pulchrum]